MIICQFNSWMKSFRYGAMFLIGSPENHSYMASKYHYTTFSHLANGYSSQIGVFIFIDAYCIQIQLCKMKIPDLRNLKFYENRLTHQFDASQCSTSSSSDWFHA